MDGEVVTDTLREEMAKLELCESVTEDVISKNLPEYLVEKIIAMVPFPWLCTARGLSKSWLSRFSSISSEDNEGNKCLAASFQKQVDEWSKNWETLCPFFLNEEMSVAYNGRCHVWQKMPSLSFLPNNLLSRSTVQTEGALVYLFSGTPDERYAAPRFEEYEMYVANVLTRSWKQLPPPPYAGTLISHKFVKLAPLEMYKVILLSIHDLCDKHVMGLSAQIYDAESDTWIFKKFVVHASFKFEEVSSSYLDGVVYMVGLRAQRLLAFNVEELAIEESGLKIESPDLMHGYHRLVVCNGNLLMIIGKFVCEWRTDAPWMRVLKIDVGSLRVSQLAEGPPAALDAGTIQDLEPVSDGKSIYFGLTECGKRVLAYNTDTNEWSCCRVHVPDTGNDHKWICSSFQQPQRPDMDIEKWIALQYVMMFNHAPLDNP